MAAYGTIDAATVTAHAKLLHGGGGAAAAAAGSPPLRLSNPLDDLMHTLALHDPDPQLGSPGGSGGRHALSAADATPISRFLEPSPTAAQSCSPQLLSQPSLELPPAAALQALLQQQQQQSMAAAALLQQQVEPGSAALPDPTAAAAHVAAVAAAAGSSGHLFDTAQQILAPALQAYLQQRRQQQQAGQHLSPFACYSEASELASPGTPAPGGGMGASMGGKSFCGPSFFGGGGLGGGCGSIGGGDGSDSGCYDWQAAPLLVQLSGSHPQAAAALAQAASLPLSHSSDSWAAAAATPAPQPFPGTPLLPTAAAASLPYGSSSLSLMLAGQLPPHLRLQALLQQRQHQEQQQQRLQAQEQQQHRGACRGGGQPWANQQRMPHQAAAFLAHQMAQADQEPPENLVGVEGRYQPYCQQAISLRLNDAATRALTTIKMLQAADAAGNSVMAGKRFYCSLKEVSKVVFTARCIIVAPDVRTSPTAHINPVRMLQRILQDAHASNVPVIFALSRRGIGQMFGRDKSMSIVAVMHLDGLEGEFGVMLEEAIQGRQQYMQLRGSPPAAGADAAAAAASAARSAWAPANVALAPASLAFMQQLQAGFLPSKQPHL